MKLFRIGNLLKTAAIVSIGALAVSCGPKPKGNQVGTMVCDKSFENIMREQIMVFENRFPDAVVGCQYVTQSEAIQRFMSGDTRLAVLGRDLTPDELKKLRSRKDTKNVRSMKIAVDAVALIVNPENPVEKLTVKEIERILKGEVKSWAQVQPGAPDQPIHVVVDDPQSSMTAYMREKLMNGSSFDKTVVITADSVSGVFNRVKQHKGDIGVIGVSWLTHDLTEPEPLDSILARQNSTDPVDGVALNEKMNKSGVKTIGVMHNSLVAYKPTQENIYSGDYPLTRSVYMVTTAAPTTILGKFYTFVTSTDGQRLMMSTGVMPARLEIKVYEISN